VPAGQGAIGIAVREQRAVASADLLEDPRVVLADGLRARLVQTPNRAVLAVPLVADGVAVAVCLVVDRAGTTFTEQDVLLAEAFAHHAALAIANARRFDAVRREEQALSSFFEHAAVPLHWAGPDGIIVRANAAELAMLGYSEAEYIGRHIAELHVDPATIDDMLQRLRAGQTLRDYPARLRARDGSIRHVIIDANVHRDGGRFVHMRCFTRDVTGLRAAEEEMARLLAAERAARAEAEAAERQMAVLDEIARSITSSLDLGVVLQRIAQGAQELCASDTAAMFLRDGDSDAMVPRYRVGPAVRAYEGLRIEPGRGIGGHVLLTGRPLRTEAYRDDPRVPRAFHAIADETGTVTLMVVPITIHERVEGLLYISNRTARSFSERDEAVCVRLAEQAAVAIGNARLFADAQAASRAKDDFLAVLSHELRTPLNAIVGWARMLQAGALTPALTAKAIDVIDRNAAAQVQLIEDLLDVSRIVSGTLRLQRGPVKVAPVLSGALDAVRPTAERKGVRLVALVADTVDVVEADAGRLQQVVWNLLTNAVKFTPRDGTITVTAEEDGEAVRISVADTGVGIDAAALPHVFERFRQADSSTTRQHGGLGLGLALVKHITELHGGTVEAASDGPGKGATFRITLPRTRTPAHAVGAPAPAAAQAVQLAGASVLVMDDEADARDLCAAALAGYGATVATVTSAAEALHQVEAVKPDVVVADLGMPGEDGFAFIRRLRAHESSHGRRAIVVALTAFVSLEDRLRALDAGFDAHVAKPFDPVELATTIQSLLRPDGGAPAA
jgi:PAS domain S-box-containing protein